MNNLDQAKELRERFSKIKTFYDYSEYLIVKDMSKQLKEEVEKGCGRYLLPIGSYKSCGKKTPLSLNDEGINYCKDCQETLNILKEILE